MTDNHTKRTFGAVKTTPEDVGKDWREISRSEMFERLIVAVDGAKSVFQNPTWRHLLISAEIAKR